MGLGIIGFIIILGALLLSKLSDKSSKFEYDNNKHYDYLKH